jgi:hypothetical protein
MPNWRHLTSGPGSTTSKRERMAQNVWPYYVAWLLACTALASPAAAQREDAAYCAQLANLALRYTGTGGGDGGLRPDLETQGAIIDCNKGNTAAGIRVLERKLRNNGVTLPRR